MIDRKSKLIKFIEESLQNLIYLFILMNNSCLFNKKIFSNKKKSNSTESIFRPYKRCALCKFAKLRKYPGEFRSNHPQRKNGPKSKYINSRNCDFFTFSLFLGTST